jgi:hypothetical protein
MGYRLPSPDPRIDNSSDPFDPDVSPQGQTRNVGDGEISVEDPPHYNGLNAPSGYQLTYGENRRKKPLLLRIAICFLVGAIIIAVVLAPNLGLSNSLVDSWFNHDSDSTIGEVALISPSNGADLFSDSVLLSWSSVEGADSYSLSIIGPNLESMNITVRDNQYHLTDVDDLSFFSWSVCAIKDGKTGPSSQVWTFSVKTVMDIPILLSPQNGHVFLDDGVSLHWVVVLGAEKYRVQISGDANFTQLVSDLIVETTTLVPTVELAEGQNYYWRVASIHDPVIGAWSDAQSFFIPPTLFKFTHNWTFEVDDSKWSMNIDIPSSAYYAAKNTYRPSYQYIQGYATYVQPDDPLVKEIATKLKDMAISKGYDSYQTANFVLSFLQTMPHGLDNETTGMQNYPRYPVETLVDYTGDCEDFNALYASIIQSPAFNYDGILVYLTNGVDAHIAVGLNVNPPVSGLAYWTYLGTKYYYADAMAYLPMVGLPWDPYTWAATFIPC